MKSAFFFRTALLFTINQLNEAQDITPSKNRVSLRGVQTRRQKHIALNENDKKTKSRSLQMGGGEWRPIIEKPNIERPNSGKRPKKPDLKESFVGVNTDITQLIMGLLTTNVDEDNKLTDAVEDQVVEVSEELENQWEEISSQFDTQSAAPPVSIDIDSACLEGLFRIETVDEETSETKYDYFLSLHTGHCVVVDSRRCPTDLFSSEQIDYSECAPDCLRPNAENPC